MYTVLGASGYIGSALARCLTAAGEACFAPKRGDDSLFHRPLGHVIYCIGLTADYAQRPLEAVEAHVGFLRDVLAGAKFDSLVYLSSTRLYDSQPAGGAGAPCREDGDLVLNPNTPRHIYDLSKATGEAMCLQASGGRGRAVRLSCVYGGDIGQDSFLHTTIRKALTHRSLELATAPDTARDYIHLDDVVRLLPEIARRGARGLYNLASGVNVTNRELLAAVGEATGCTIRMTGTGGVAAPLVSIERLREEFGFRPTGVLDAVPELVRQATAARGGAHRAAS
jgi:nucleoside-diphosphate-sugar epimerase